MEGPREVVPLFSTPVYNVGDTSENYQKKMIVEEIIKQLPNSKIKYVEKDEDPRDYRVSFEKIEKELGFSITYKVSDGISESSVQTFVYDNSGLGMNRDIVTAVDKLILYPKILPELFFAVASFFTEELIMT